MRQVRVERPFAGTRIRRPSVRRRGRCRRYCDFADQRVYVPVARATAPNAVTPAGYRYADFAIAADGQTFCGARGSQGAGRTGQCRRRARCERASAGTVLFDRSDFVAYPRPGADGRIAFVAWNHPNMPWDATTLHVAKLGAHGLEDMRILAGGPDGTGRIGHRTDLGCGRHALLPVRPQRYLEPVPGKDRSVEAVTAIDADFGGPLWNLGISTYALTGDGRALARVCRNAVDQLVLVDLANGRVTVLPLPFVAFGSLAFSIPSTVSRSRRPRRRLTR